MYDLKRNQAGNYKHTNYQKQHLQEHINLLALWRLAWEAVPMPPMERMAIAIRKPCSRPIGGSLREPVHLEAQQRKQPSNGGRESVISPPATSDRGAASTHEPWVLVRVMVLVVRSRQKLHSKLPESLLPLPPPALLVLDTGSPARLAMPLESDLQDGEESRFPS